MNTDSRLIRRMVLLASIAGLAVGKVWAQDAAASLALAEELERGIYLHEGKAELDEAAAVYQGILEETKLIDSLAAEARYRLALVYLDQGKLIQGNQLLQEVVDNFPGETKWVAEAKSLLPQEFVPERTPWHDGERTHYEWRLPSGDSIGKSFGTIFKFDWKGRELWRKETRYRLRGDRATAIEFDTETFVSVFSDMHLDFMGNVRTWYADDGKSARVVYSKSGAERNFDFHERIYDNEQAYELMRQMPAEVGFKTHSMVFASFAGAPVGVTFEVVGFKTVETALGKFECYEINIDLIAQQQSVFITNDERRLIVKMVAGGVEGVITKVETIDYDGHATYADRNYGYSFQYPASWGVIEPPKSDTLKHIAQPMARGAYFLNSTAKDDWKGEGELNMANLRSYLIKEIEEDFQGFELDETWTPSLNLNLPEAKAFKFSRLEEGQEEDAFVYYGIGSGRAFSMVGRLRRSEQEELLPVFEAIVGSFRFDG